MTEVSVLQDDVAEQVYNAVKYDMRRGARMSYGEHLSDEECRSIVGSAVWYCRRANPDLEGEELRKAVRKLLYTEFCEYLIAVRKYRQSRSKRGQHNIAKQLGDKIGTLPWGSPIGVEHGLVDYTEQEQDPYEQLIAKLQIDEMLVRLIQKWKHPLLALAWVLFKGYGWSIPEILELFEITKEDTNPKEYNAIRNKVWRHLSKLDDFAKEALLGEDVDRVREYFGGSE